MKRELSEFPFLLMRRYSVRRSCNIYEFLLTQVSCFLMLHPVSSTTGVTGLTEKGSMNYIGVFFSSLLFLSFQMNFVKKILTPTILTFLVFADLVSSQEPDYFPMHIGDKWAYEFWTNGFPQGTHWANQVIEVTDTTIINQKKYFVFHDTIIDLFYNPGQIIRNTHYYRKSENGDVVKYSNRINEEQLYYTFEIDSLFMPYLYFGDLDPGNDWQITFVDTDQVISIPIGTFLNCFYYFFDLWSEGHVTPLGSRALAPGIGLVQENGEGDTNFFVGAYIDGKLIGDTTITSVQEKPSSITSSRPILFQNYPNPFNSTTRFPFFVPSFWAEPIQISIFDVLGRDILSFSTEKSVDGNLEFQWDGTDRSGIVVSSGVYFVRLMSSNFFQVVKVNFQK